MRLDNNQQAFFALMRAGLWEQSVRLCNYGVLDFYDIYQIAERHGAVGLVAAGLERVNDIRIPQNVALTFAGSVLQLEQRNRAMNLFVAKTVEDMRRNSIYTILVKGQGLAQCYERPLWRPSGDVDLFFPKSEFIKAIEYFKSLNVEIFQDAHYTKSFGIKKDSWIVELHGTLRSGLSTRLDKEIDTVQRDIFYGGNVRSFILEDTCIFMPSIDNDLFLLFTHFIRHFYQNEFVLRQTCDWCRFLYKYISEVDFALLEERLRNTFLLSDWKAFAAFAVDYLGMPVEFMPLYEDTNKWRKKADKIAYYAIVNKRPSKLRDVWAVSNIFPLNTLRFLPSLLFNVNCLKIRERLLKNN